MRRVHIGLVGCGRFGESHLLAYRAVPGAEVTAVHDTDPARAARAAAAAGGARVCASPAELAALPDLDAVDVVTPEHLHLEPVLAALAGGKHVFVEKPLATDLGHCTRMIEAARAAGRSLMVGHLLRFETRYAMLREEVASGRLGRVVSMHARRNRPKAHLPLYGRVHLALETGIHDIDLMLWCAGRPVRRVRGYERRGSQGQYVDTFWGVLEFEGGALGVVESVWLLPEAAGVALDDAFQVAGTAGVGDLRLVPGGLSWWRDAGFELPDVGYDPRVMNAARGALRDELAYFCDCVREDRPPEVCTGTEAKQAVRVALALIESAAAGQDVEITEWD
jgi:predicted dehydrogenase